jgi:hypothetical protein
MLISLLIMCLVLGLLYYLIQMLPLPPPFKQIALVVIIIIAIIWLLENFGGGFLGPSRGCLGLRC